MTKPLGKVIAIEGGDGTGKTSVAKQLAIWLNDHDYKSQYVPIIEGSDAGKAYKHLYLFEGLPGINEALGMAYSVSSTLAKVQKLREELDFVILDRSLASFYVYQLEVNGYEFMREAYKHILDTPGYAPNLTIYLTVDPDTAMRRMSGRGKLDLVESRGAAYQLKIAAAYDKCFAAHRKLAPVLSINTTELNPNHVQNQAFRLIMGMYHHNLAHNGFFLDPSCKTAELLDLPGALDKA